MDYKRIAQYFNKRKYAIATVIITIILCRIYVDSNNQNLIQSNAEEAGIEFDNNKIRGEEISECRNENLTETFQDNLDNFGDKKYAINCSNINEIQLGEFLGKGARKTVHLGIFRGMKVAVKTISSDQIKDCQDNSKNKFESCRNFLTMMALNEIILHSQLSHPGLIQLLGYCVRDVLSTPIASQPIHKQSVVSVFEYAAVFEHNRTLPFVNRLQYAIDLCDVLDYLSRSPLGSLYIPDFARHNVMIHGGHLKFSDIEGLSAKEPLCTANKPCGGNVTCDEDGVCSGYNAQIMMACLRFRFLQPYLLRPIGVSEEIAQELQLFQQDYDRMNAFQAKERLSKIMQMT